MTPTESNPVKGVEGGFELDLASLAEASGKIMMSQDVRFHGSLKKGSKGWFGFVPAPTYN
jgi:hypothetical protein